jgi:CheY-like chemotaxis protein
MPGVDGFQILREKRRDESIRTIPVIVVSSINPIGETIISNSLTVTRKEGLTVSDLLGSIQSMNQVLTHSKNSYAG